MLILGAVFIGQTFFFKHYYVQKKETEITEEIQQFIQGFLPSQMSDERRDKERDFYEHTNTWITVLDQYGRPTNMNDFYIEIEVGFSSRQIEKDNLLQIPLSTLMSPHDALDEDFPLQIGSQILMYGIRVDDEVVPYAMTEGNIYSLELQQEDNLNGQMLFDWIEYQENPLFQSGSPYWENKQLYERVSRYMEEHAIDIPEPNADVVIIEETGEVQHKEKRERYLEMWYAHMMFATGTIIDVHVPTYQADHSVIDLSHSFTDQLHTFQASLLFDESLIESSDSSAVMIDEELNGIPYKIFIHPFQVDKQTYYVWAMTSLQPVDEVLEVMGDYFIYFIVIVMVLILLLSFYYSKKIASPLLIINKTTEQMAQLDFSENIPIHSRDELGTLSQNINMLSKKLHHYILKLQGDIEKEKRLEQTRKEFVSGVSHELKTPLSIMKSTLSILQSDIAIEKRPYYFQALEQEVDRMDRLVVDMLDLTKYESGTYQLETAAFDIDETIRRVYNQLLLSTLDKHIYFHLNIYPVRVVANEHRIGQVITNFVTNAIRHTYEHGNINIYISEEDNEVKVCVENTGEFIEESQIDRVWDRFYRGDVARHRTKGETGLGLAISKRILDLHHSSYGVENTAQGVLFYFYLQKNRD